MGNVGGISSGRLRSAGGATLVVLSVAFVAFAAWANSVQGEGSLGPLFAMLTMVVLVGPTVLAAVGVLAGGTRGAIFGCLVSWSCCGILFWIFSGWSSDAAGTIVQVVLVIAYGSAGLIAFMTVHARDQRHGGAAG